LGIAVIEGGSLTATTLSGNEVLLAFAPSLIVAVIVAGEPTGVD